MGSFTIDTRAVGSDENNKPHIELYHSDESLYSVIQETAIGHLEKYDSHVYDVSESPGMAERRGVSVVPTTIAMDMDYEIERWEGPTHADNIRNVLDAW